MNRKPLSNSRRSNLDAAKSNTESAMVKVQKELDTTPRELLMVQALYHLDAARELLADLLNLYGRVPEPEAAEES